MIRHRLAILMLCLVTTACATSWAKNQAVKEAIDQYNCRKETKGKLPDYNDCLIAKGDARLTDVAKEREEEANAIDRNNCRKETKGNQNIRDCLIAKGAARRTAVPQGSEGEKQAFYGEGEKQAFYVDRFDCWREAKDRSQRYFDACMRAKGYEKRSSTSNKSEGELVPYSTP
jgi:hypothetical protein